MSSLGSPSPFFLAGKKAYAVDRSLRFNPSDNANLTRTSSSASTTFTYSAWIKRSTFTGYQYIFSIGNRGFAFHTNNNTFYLYDGTGLNESTAVFRDPSAWYHIVVQINSGVATSYINNQLVHNAIGSGFTLTTGSNETRMGVYNSNDYDFSGYMAEINLVDGSVLAPSSFAETDATTGQWIPKKYVGSYGTNGFYLNFSDNSGTTATTLGKDSSGNGNNFTPNNFSVAAGVGNDSVPDSPTNNFCTFNPLKVNASNPLVFTEGNLQHNGVSGDNHLRSSSTMQVNSGKWYVEFKFISGYEATNSTVSFGLTTDAANNRASNVDAFWYQNTDNFVAIAYRNNGVLQVFLEGSSQSTLSGMPTFVNGDVMGLAVDLDNDKLFVSKNGTFFSNGTGTQDPAAGTNPVYSGGYLTSRKSDGFYFSVDGYSAQVVTADFGQQGYAYTPPSGFKKVNSANLPDPTIKLPNKHFDILLYTGTDSAVSRTLTGLNFKPDWVWQKRRNGTNWHGLHDTVRGGGKTIYANSSNAEATNNQYGYISAFTSDGFTWSPGSTNNSDGNEANGTFVSWCWDAGETDGKTYTVKVVSDSGNKYRFDDFGTSAVTIRLAKGGTYIFDQSDSSNAGHPLRFSATSNGTHGGGTEYTTGVTTVGTPGQAGAYTQIVVDASAPVLYYYCTQHSGMGGQVDTNTDLGSSNFDGSIQSLVKVNPSAGFSIVAYTGTGSAGATVGHGLGVTPNTIIIKNRSDSSSAQWTVYHSAAFNSASDPNILYWNTNNAEADDTNVLGTSVTINSTKFSLGDYNGSNGNGDNIVAYCFSEVAGYSKFGEYTGNGSSNGTFVYTGFRPAWTIIKQTGQMDWVIDDTTRSPFNESNATLFTNLNDAEYTGGAYGIDFLSNGFKPYNTYTQYNGSGGKYIYFAFAESPFKNARAR